MNNCSIENLKQRLQERQCKLTSQRQLILQIFIDNAAEHLSAEDVHLLLKNKKNDIGLATVYRGLELLSEMDILHKIDFGDGKLRYEINSDESEHYHHHLICLKCGCVMEFADDLLESLEHDIELKNGFKIIDHQLKFYGYCRECQRGEN